MGAFGNEDHRPRIAARFKGSTDRKDTAQLAVGTCFGCHSNADHARQFDQPDREFVDHAQRTLHGFNRLKRMNVGKALHPRDFLIQAGVVLHGAGTEREEAEINGIILARQAGIMAHGFWFAEARQADGAGAVKVAEALANPGRWFNINPRRCAVADLKDQSLFEHERPVSGKSCGS